MKSHITHISIPQPCTQQWANMQPNEHGRFCDSCQKSVIDFSAMTDKEVIDVLSSSQDVCGKFGTNQIGSLNYRLSKHEKQAFFWKKLGLAAAFIGFLPFSKTEAQTRTDLKQHIQPVIKNTAINEVTPTTIRGAVIDKASGQPISGATLNIQGKPEIAITDINGIFVIECRLTGDTVLECSYAGHSTADVTINKYQSFYTIALSAREIPTAPEVCNEVITGTLGGISFVTVQERSWRDDPFLLDLVHRLFGW